MRKITKSIIILGLLASMVAVMTGCGEKNEISPKDNQSSDTQTENTTPITSDQGTNESTTFSRGEWNDNVYSNSFLGLKLTLPSNWQKYSDEQIAQLMNVGKELLNDDTKALADLAEQTAVYFIVVNNPSNGDTVQIIGEKPLTTVTTDYYISVVKEQLETLESIEYTAEDGGEKTIAGKKFRVLNASTIVSGQTVHQDYYVTNIDGYLVSIIVSSLNNTINLDEMISQL